MRLVPMPSPKGTNHANLFIDERILGKRSPQAAYDSAEGLEGGAMKKYSELMAELTEPQKAKLQQLIRALVPGLPGTALRLSADADPIMAWVRTKLSAEDVARYASLVDAQAKRAADAKPRLAADKAATRAVPARTEPDRDGYAKRFPEAARIKVV